ncbi:MAG: 50S ribosomal protein L3 [Candidatus Sungbacteria bacterium RIFCSPLOWO2_02_FULL_51_17]|uniref:Large ribosomal subunit protein uL3 n=1 Tax=Candidatus Sungbacteria bacterium RIFCSPHIGHO2_02_FULL_51_29 TaxID=1802273 RepID=A0A1G2KTE4_9BACT|nr:MAG: 50S ribosomal protein L3 [Candidatus Sungbacteria bacterium RIFCSPHIGHO2_01_FULL_51_22]OHA02494.1 MAG: 50S ribosomal protein L3 [Candidatus Sungbacteria bacterium RIFCSPHIGHO2_02_FULL_51_29]OHA07951.1 MAG: 50S ribosomal protein L3 [Candidatus Sungbacteria bacterium RIFCSPLOWO2_01_FULL_51_34]OHA11929.1 MAG: 50S ribosomal protein L3 [Candidatus Sungbacteria bacterium RIFCSPLOWO2_02_FULL_51_17]
MAKFILGEKLGMSQVFDKEGNVTPVTVVHAVPNIVLQARTKEKDGYAAVQVGMGERKPKNIAKQQKGHFGELGNFRWVREFRTDDVKSRGDKVDVSVFSEGDVIRVSGITKAKGFQGVMKRHGFHGKDASHGTKHAHREPGSIGGGGGRAGGRVVKGKKMAGRMGGERQTVKNLKVVKVDAENNLIAVLGAIPGRRGALIEIRG